MKGDCTLLELELHLTALTTAEVRRQSTPAACAQPHMLGSSNCSSPVSIPRNHNSTIRVHSRKKESCSQESRWGGGWGVCILEMLLPRHLQLMSCFSLFCYLSTENDFAGRWKHLSINWLFRMICFYRYFRHTNERLISQ